MSIRKISIFVVTLLLLVGCIACSQIPHAVRCAYIEWGLAQSIIQYMDEHDREMPNKIEDLRPYFRKGEGNLSSLESIDQSVDYVIVDFHSLKRCKRNCFQALSHHAPNVYTRRKSIDYRPS